MAFLIPDKEPFLSASPFALREGVFAKRHFIGLPMGDSFPSGSDSSLRIAFVSFEAAGLSGIAAKGRHAFPSPYLSKVVTQFRLSLRSSVPCGTHNYTRFERAVNKNFHIFLNFFGRYHDI